MEDCVVEEARAFGEGGKEAKRRRGRKGEGGGGGGGRERQACVASRGRCYVSPFFQVFLKKKIRQRSIVRAVVLQFVGQVGMVHGIN